MLNIWLCFSQIDNDRDIAEFLLTAIVSVRFRLKEQIFQRPPTLNCVVETRGQKVDQHHNKISTETDGLNLILCIWDQ